MSSTTYYFDSERLKPLVTSFIYEECRFSEVPAQLKKPLRLYVHENIPSVWLSDGFHYLEA